jgi:hypothetical protein
VSASAFPDLAPAELTAYQEAGATWWLESIAPGLPLIDFEQRVRAGTSANESRLGLDRSLTVLGLGDQRRRSLRSSWE